MAGIVAALRTEFASELRSLETGENQSMRMESVYTRMTGISGTPLADSSHFGQTIYNDEGRPYQEGFNSITGFSSYATSDRFAVYFSGEFLDVNGANVPECLCGFLHRTLRGILPTLRRL